MAEYRETVKTIQERHWRQAAKAGIESRTGAGRRVWRFVQEDVIEKDGGAIESEPAGEFELDFNATTTFPLLRLQDGQPTGQTMTHRELLAALYSLYRAAATERNA